VATRGNRRQIDGRLKRQKQAKSVAARCHRLRATFHGKDCHEERASSSDRLRLVDWSYREEARVQCCTPVWISAASVSTSICSTRRVRRSRSERLRLMPTVCTV